MDVITLLQEARAAGLRLEAIGHRLVVRGPRRLDALARQLIARKPEVIAALAEEAGAAPAPRCAICGRHKFQLQGRRPRCFVCDGPFLPMGGGGESQ